MDTKVLLLTYLHPIYLLFLLLETWNLEEHFFEVIEVRTVLEPLNKIKFLFDCDFDFPFSSFLLLKTKVPI